MRLKKLIGNIKFCFVTLIMWIISYDMSLVGQEVEFEGGCVRGKY